MLALCLYDVTATGFPIQVLVSITWLLFFFTVWQLIYIVLFFCARITTI